MASGHYEFQSDFAKHHFARGRDEGRTEGEAKAVLAVLEARGLVVPEQARKRILACTDLTQLDHWVRQAVTVAAVDELFT